MKQKIEDAKTDAAHLKSLEGRLKAEETASAEAKLAAETKKLDNVKKEKTALEALEKAQKDEQAANATEADKLRAQNAQEEANKQILEA